MQLELLRNKATKCTKVGLHNDLNFKRCRMNIKAFKNQGASTSLADARRAHQRKVGLIQQHENVCLELMRFKSWSQHWEIVHRSDTVIRRSGIVTQMLSNILAQDSKGQMSKSIGRIQYSMLSRPQGLQWLSSR